MLCAVARRLLGSLFFVHAILSRYLPEPVLFEQPDAKNLMDKLTKSQTQFKRTFSDDYKGCMMHSRRCVVDWLDCTHVLPTITHVYLMNFQRSISRDVDSFLSNLGDSVIVHTSNPIPLSVLLVTSSWRAKWPINDVKCPVSPNHVL